MLCIKDKVAGNGLENKGYFFMGEVNRNMGCHGQVVKSIEFKFCWLSHRSEGLNPGQDTLL